MNAQTTLRAPVAFDGVGLHTGARVRAEVRPAPVDAGLTFLLGDRVRVPATAEHVIDTSRATVVGRAGAAVSTVEHLLSAIFGMGISNAEIAVSGPEIPAADGSGRAFAEAFTAAGIEEQGVVRAVRTLDRPYELRDDDRAVVLLPADTFRVRFVADFPVPVGAQYFDGEITPQSYWEEICGARTFGYLREVQELLDRGLAQGGSLENAVVFDEEGPLCPLRWPNEVVRHKVLDLLGDFALLGEWPQFEIIAIKSGHALHTAAVRALREKNLCRG